MLVNPPLHQEKASIRPRISGRVMISLCLLTRLVARVRMLGHGLCFARRVLVPRGLWR